MSQQKRRFEEYHDPDYPQLGEPETKRLRGGEEFESDKNVGGTFDVVTERADKTERIRAIVRREFERELGLKEQELNRIEHKLLQAKRLLQRVRYAVVFSYYTKKNLEYSEIEQRNELTLASASSETAVVEPSASGESQPTQKAVHPSLKKLLGKTTIDYNEILKMRPARQAAKDAKTSIADKLRSKKEERRLRMLPTETVINHSLSPVNTTTPSTSAEPIKVPRYISPIKIDRPIGKINTARGRNQSRHLIAVGNTSKYIGDDQTQQGVTHKWLVYVRTKTDEATVEEIVAKVRFFLHPSYRPNDVVEVDSSPFQISRRGWGEFPIRVQLYFHAHIQQKPLQIFHNLVLDKKLTGLQTMGAETVVEMWLKLPAKPILMLSPIPQSPQRLAAGQLTPTRKLLTPKKNTPVTVNGEHQQQQQLPVECVPSTDYVEAVKSGGVELLEPVESQIMEVAEQPVWDHESVISDDFKSPRATSSITEHCNGNGNIQLPEPTPITASGIPINPEATTTTSLMTPPATPMSVAPAVPNTSIAIPTANSKMLTPPILSPPTQPRKLMKCLDSNGKVILVEIQVDPNNPKSFKIIKNPNQLVNPSPLIKINPTKPLAQTTTNTNTIRVAPTAITSTKPILNGINGQLKELPPGRMIVLPKSTLTTNMNNNGTTSKISTIPNTNGLSRLMLQQQKPLPQQQQQPRLPNQMIRPILKPNPTTIIKTQLPSGLIKPNNVIMRNGKVFIIDPSKVVAKSVLAPPTSSPKPSTTPTNSFPSPKSFSSSVSSSHHKPKQQSLLKPQISLLKPRPGNVVASPLVKPSSAALRPTIKTNSTPPHQQRILSNIAPNAQRPKLQMLQRRNFELPKPILNGGQHHPPIGRLMRLPNVFLPAEKSVFNTSTGSRIVLHPPRRDYRRELEHQFLRQRHFDNRRSAVEFLLRQVPLVHRLANEPNHPEFGQAFPFALGTTAAYEGLMLPKQRSVEWCRANFIGRLLHKHPELRSLPTWSTKDIVLFARQFGYTPRSSSSLATNDASRSSNNPTANDDRSKLTSLIKKEMKREQSQHETLTVNQRIVDWLNEWNKKRLHRRLATDDGLVINVDDDDDKVEAKKSVVGGGKVKDVSEVKSLRPIAWLPLDSQLKAENALVTEVCHSMQIKLPPEEIVQGVLHNSAQLVMVTALQSFVADLLRRANGCLRNADSDSSSPQPMAVTVDHLRSCLATTTHFDFLTNRYFGSTSNQPQTTSIVKTEPSTTSS